MEKDFGGVIFMNRHPYKVFANGQFLFYFFEVFPIFLLIKTSKYVFS